MGIEIQSVTGKTSLVGVMGWPVEHSLSPAMHNAAFAALGIDWLYVPMPVHPEDVRRAIKGLAALGFVGANVTVPHKQAVMRYIDELSDAARATGAVNTIHIKDGTYYGYNTDAIGFLNSFSSSPFSPPFPLFFFLFSFGAARSFVFSFSLSFFLSVPLLNRTAERAAFLVDDLTDTFPNSHLHFAALTGEAILALGDHVDLVVNTTSVGMSPNIEACPWPDDVPMPRQATFCDLVYNPLETKLLARAHSEGLNTIDGLGMLVHQGAYALETWTGQQAPVDVMRQACLARLGQGPVTD